MIKGGQGRDPQDLMNTAALLFWMVIGAIIWTALLVLAGCWS